MKVLKRMKMGVSSAICLVIILVMSNIDVSNSEINHKLCDNSNSSGIKNIELYLRSSEVDFSVLHIGFEDFRETVKLYGQNNNEKESIHCYLLIENSEKLLGYQAVISNLKEVSKLDTLKGLSQIVLLLDVNYIDGKVVTYFIDDNFTSYIHLNNIKQYVCTRDFLKIIYQDINNKLIKKELKRSIKLCM